MTDSMVALHNPSRQVHAVVDLQFGSTGKGLLVGWLAKHIKPDTLVTAWCPNAGHTFINDEGRKYIHTMLGNGVVANKSLTDEKWRMNRALKHQYEAAVASRTPGYTGSIETLHQPLRRVMIGPGSCINLPALFAEVDQCRDHLRETKIYIHGNASLVFDRHRDEEREFNRIGSTSKGSAASLIEKMQRKPGSDIIARDFFKMTHYGSRLGYLPSLVDGDPRFERNGVEFEVVSNERWLAELAKSRVVLVEGAQGYGLSINHGDWPYVTSRDCTTARLIADCGLPFNFGKIEVWGVARTLPIRVANRHNENGGGSSGPGRDDQQELDWASLGREPELTTVTKLPRRIFTFSMKQFREALAVNGVNHVFMNFMNYLNTTGSTGYAIDGTPVAIPGSVRFRESIERVCKEMGADLSLLGVGGCETDVIDLRPTKVRL